MPAEQLRQRVVWSVLRLARALAHSTLFQRLDSFLCRCSTTRRVTQPCSRFAASFVALLFVRQVNRCSWRVLVPARSNQGVAWARMFVVCPPIVLSRFGVHCRPYHHSCWSSRLGQRKRPLWRPLQRASLASLSKPKLCSACTRCSTRATRATFRWNPRSRRSLWL